MRRRGRDVGQPGNILQCGRVLTARVYVRDTEGRESRRSLSLSLSLSLSFFLFLVGLQPNDLHIAYNMAVRFALRNGSIQTKRCVSKIL